MSLDSFYYYFQFEGSFGSFVSSKVLIPKSSWTMICEFVHHLVYHQCAVQAIKYTKHQKMCSVLLWRYRHLSHTWAGGVPGGAEPRSHGVAEVLCREPHLRFAHSGSVSPQICTLWKCLTSDLHPIASIHLGESPQFLFVSSWTGCAAPCFPFPSHPTCFHHNSMDVFHPPACFSVPKSCGQQKLWWLGGACMPAGQPNVHVGMGWKATSRLNKGWAVSAFPSGTDAPLALVFLCGQMVQSNVWELSDFEPCVFLLNLIEMGELQGKVLSRDDTLVSRADTQILVQTGCKSHVGIVS